MPSFLILSWALSFGFLPSSSVAVYDSSGQHYFGQAGALTQTIELGLTAWDTVTVWTNIETYDRFEKVTKFAPFRSDYNIGLNVGRNIAGFRFDGGIRHECVHPVINGGVKANRIASGETEIYFKISGRIGE